MKTKGSNIKGREGQWERQWRTFGALREEERKAGDERGKERRLGKESGKKRA